MKTFKHHCSVLKPLRRLVASSLRYVVVQSSPRSFVPSLLCCFISSSLPFFVFCSSPSFFFSLFLRFFAAALLRPFVALPFAASLLRCFEQTPRNKLYSNWPASFRIIFLQIWKILTCSNFFKKNKLCLFSEQLKYCIEFGLSSCAWTSFIYLFYSLGPVLFCA